MNPEPTDTLPLTDPSISAEPAPPIEQPQPAGESGGEGGAFSFKSAAQGRAAGLIDSGRDQLAGTLSSLASTVQEIAEKADPDTRELIEKYATRASEWIEGFADRVREKDGADLLANVGRLAKQHPVAVAGLSAAIAAVAVRLLPDGKPGA